mgnify:CR=1 FL=1
MTPALRAVVSGESIEPRPRRSGDWTHGGARAHVEWAMIIARTSTPLLRVALRRAARPDEDVVVEPVPAERALRLGFPRLVVREADDGGPSGPSGASRVPILTVGDDLLGAWERERKAEPIPRSRVDFVAPRLRALIREAAPGPSWVDRRLAEIDRAAGGPLPRPFKGMARRVMEFPSRYTDLRPLAELTGISRGALKARFRRRDLATPSTWLRWFRVMAAAHVLSRPGTTTLRASYHLGFAHGGNLCRLVRDVSGMTPTDLREPGGSGLLVLRFAASELEGRDVRSAWASLDDLFLEAVA